jgi:Predicted transcriptional regulator
MTMPNHDALLRLPQVLTLVPVSRASWYAGIKVGRYPQQVQLGPRTVAWRRSDIERLIDSLGQEVAHGQ